MPDSSTPEPGIPVHDVSTMQRSLNALYAESLLALQSNTEHGVSNPLFIAVPESDEHAALRLVIVGQQTCSWYDDLGPLGLEQLLACYRKLDLARHGPHSPFWRYAHRLQRLLAPKVPPRGFVWANVIPCDQHRLRPKPEVLDRLLMQNLLPRELGVLDPHAVVFFTGPHYDVFLQRLFPGVSFQAVDGQEKRMLCRLEHPQLPCLALRTHHPKYLQLKKLDVLSKIAEQVRSIEHALHRPRSEARIVP